MIQRIEVKTLLIIIIKSSKFAPSIILHIYSFFNAHDGTSLGSPQGSTQVEQALREPVTLERSTSVYIPARRSTSN